jgi:hypothetical protein
VLQDLAAGRGERLLEEDRPRMYGFNAAFHDPSKLDSIFPEAGSRSRDDGFVTEQWWGDTAGSGGFGDPEDAFRE